jgi:hypothetical protein
MILKISNKSIFITHNQYYKLRSLAGFKNNSIDSLFDWSKKTNTEVNELLVNAINNLNLSESEFLEQFVNINLAGYEAKENTYNFIFDYIRHSKLNFKLISGETHINYEQVLMMDYKGEFEDFFPMGRNFYLVHYSQKKNNCIDRVLSFIRGSTSKQFDIVKLNIDTEHVIRIEGCFGFVFRIHFDNNQVMEYRWWDSSDEIGPGIKILNSNQDLVDLKLNFNEFISGRYFKY